MRLMLASMTTVLLTCTCWAGPECTARIYPNYHPELGKKIDLTPINLNAPYIGLEGTLDGIYFRMNLDTGKKMFDMWATDTISKESELKSVGGWPSNYGDEVFTISPSRHFPGYQISLNCKP